MIVSRMRAAIADQEPICSFAISRIETECLTEEDRGGLILVAPGRELAEQAVREAASGIEPNDVAEVGLSIEIATQSDVRSRAHQKKRHALGLVIERIGDNRDHPGVMPCLEQLRRRRDDSAVHEHGCSKGWASRSSL
ncbi:MAG: hypothetical protein JWO36_6576 [Myxococcales bacterium]|nr:hypothetical protein [Myxococcales bacterium]